MISRRDFFARDSRQCGHLTHLEARNGRDIRACQDTKRGTGPWLVTRVLAELILEATGQRT